MLTQLTKTGALLALLLVAACATINPFAAAKTTEQRAYALYGTFVVYQEQAASLSRTPDLPLTVRQAIRDAENKAKPGADQLYLTIKQVVALKRGLAGGTTTQERVDLALVELTRLITQNTPRIQELVRKVDGK